MYYFHQYIYICPLFFLNKLKMFFLIYNFLDQMVFFLFIKSCFQKEGICYQCGTQSLTFVAFILFFSEIIFFYCCFRLKNMFPNFLIKNKV